MNNMDNRFKKFAKGIPIADMKYGGNAIIYNRISSKEQQENQSLETQLNICLTFAEKNNFVVVEKFGGVYESAKSDKERKEFTKMLTYLRKNNNKIQAVIVFSTSRFSRTGSTVIIEEIEKLGAMVISATSNFDPRTATGKFVQSIELATARLDNDTKKIYTIENSKTALHKGRWIGKAPRGYDQKTTKSEQIITINADGEKIKQAFLWKANEKCSNETIIKRLNNIGFSICKQKLSELFKNPFYCGLMRHNFLEGEVIRGNHPPIISEEIFLKVNHLLERSHKNGYEVKNGKPEVPLIGTLKCPACDSNLTSAVSTKLRKKYNREVFYYTCWRKGCKHNIASKIVHTEFKKELNSFALSEVSTTILEIQLKKTFESLTEEYQNRKKNLRTELTKTLQDIDQVSENWAMAKEPKLMEACKKSISRLEDKKNEIEDEIRKMDESSLNLPNFIEFGLKMKNNLLNLWELSDLDEKKNFQNLVFPNGICFDKNNGHIEPLSVNQFIALKPLNTRDSEDKKKGTISQNNQMSLQVPGAGLEPARP